MPHVPDRDLSDSELQELLGGRLTYSEHGATQAELPEGYRHVEIQARCGYGRSTFDVVSRLVMTWEMHRRAGLDVRASQPVASDGTVAVLRLGVGVFGVNAPVRVVREVNEHWRRGFAYGTLPGHPESGEELFLVQHHSNDEVTLTIKAFSNAATRLARSGGPFARGMQWRITQGYLDAAMILGREHSDEPKRPWFREFVDKPFRTSANLFVGLVALVVSIGSFADSGITYSAAFTAVVAVVGLATPPYVVLRHRRLSSPLLN